MAGIELYDYQLDAVKKMKNGCILCGGVGSGKSRTSLAYYYLCEGGEIGTDEYVPMGDPPKDLYIITTARKRDTLEWEGELSPFLLSPNPERSLYCNKVVVDSWNNIKKYSDVTGAFFIFDEQRVVGSGEWVKSFLKITRKNHWILLSATPGDTWQDYIPVFLANGFYKNRSEFIQEHVVYSRFTKFPKIDKYLNTGRLIRLRNSILVNMDFKRQTISHHEDVFVSYNIEMYKDVSRTRWNPYKNEPITNAGSLCYIWRKIVNTDEARQVALLEIVEKHPRAIIFYNFDYELELLKELFIPHADTMFFEIAEWNGHCHQPIPECESWVYLVQYNAGAEGWNCIKTDTIVFYSQNYSYKIMQQSAGRIDRLNTPYKDLYYYHLKSRSGIDLAISRALKEKKNFNEAKYVKW
ncbi:MAG: hypothetical protein KH921_07080 [Erysipelotrichaceae bacterium]|nr:hypothetical protein [Erysipelotrichaceae bacterium]